ncbi:MAG: hypothetical protein ACOCV2_02765, partial [Persicimonas sp.]
MTLIGLGLPTVVEADPFDPDDAEHISRDKLGTLEGKTLYYRVFWRNAQLMRTESKAQVFWTDRRDEFERLPSEEETGTQADDDDFEYLPDDDLEVLYERRSVEEGDPRGSLQFDEENEYLSERSSSTKTKIAWMRDVELKRILAWSSEDREFRHTRTDFSVPEYQSWAELLRFDPEEAVAEFGLRVLFMDPKKEYQRHGSECDPEVALLIFDTLRERIDSLVAQGDEDRAVRILSALVRYRGMTRLKFASDGATADDLVWDIEAPICGAFLDLDQLTTTADSAFKSDIEISGCASGHFEPGTSIRQGPGDNQRDWACDEGQEIEREWSADTVESWLLDYGELAAAQGDEELAIMLTLHVGNRERADGSGPYPSRLVALAPHGDKDLEPNDLEPVIEFADALADDDRLRLAAAYDRRVLRAVKDPNKLPDRIEKRADRHPAPDRDAVGADELGRRIEKRLDDGLVLEATGELLARFDAVADADDDRLRLAAAYDRRVLR